MNSTTYIVTTLLAFVLGQWLVTRKHWAGFLVWCAANVYSIVTCVITDMPQTSLLFAAYFLVNFASLRSWFRKGRIASGAELPAVPAAAFGTLLRRRVRVLQLAPSRVHREAVRDLAVTGP